MHAFVFWQISNYCSYSRMFWLVGDGVLDQIYCAGNHEGDPCVRKTSGGALLAGHGEENETELLRVCALPWLQRITPRIDGVSDLSILR